jgi:hypothetical protein
MINLRFRDNYHSDDDEPHLSSARLTIMVGVTL